MQIEKDGQTIEVFTPEELAAKQKEAVDAATAPLQQQLNEAQDKLAKANDKDFNFATLRQQVQDLQAKMETAKADALAEFEATGRQRLANDAIVKLADGDAELQKKIELYFSRLNNGLKTDLEIKKAVLDAFKLARGPETQGDPLADVFGSGGASPIFPKKDDPSRPALTDNQLNVLRYMYPGLTDEQIKDLDSKAQPAKTEKITPGEFGGRTI